MGENATSFMNIEGNGGEEGIDALVVRSPRSAWCLLRFASFRTRGFDSLPSRVGGLKINGGEEGIDAHVVHSPRSAWCLLRFASFRTRGFDSLPSLEVMV